MEALFRNSQRFNEDIFIGDYSEYAQKHPDCEEQGVVMSKVPIANIASLHFINHQHIPVLGINFERNLGYFKEQECELASNCECMLVSDKAKKRGWLVLAELKYCGGDPRTVMDNFSKALSQVKETFLYLRDVKHLFGELDHRYIWVISIPEHDELIPFSQFYHSQDKLLEYKNQLHVDLLCTNTIEILTHQHVRMLVG